MNTKLSIILPLKGREQFTERFIKSVDGAAQLIVADGSKEPQFPPFFERPNIDYFYSGYDHTYAHWFFKMVLAFDRVQTPYAMIANNDDIVVPSGLAKCVEFLDNNPDYVAVSGRLRGFWCWPNPVTGPHFSKSKQYAMYDVPADYNQNTANERVLAGFQNSWSFYAVYRTEALKTIWREVQEIDFSDLQVHEKFCAMRALTLGKIKCDRSFMSYLRQYGTSQGAAGQLDFATRLLASQFSADRDAVLKRMEFCEVDIMALRQKWAVWYDAYLRREYGPWRQFRQVAKKRFPKLAWLAQNRHRYLPLKWSYR